MGGTTNGGFVYSLGATAGERSEKGGFLLSFQYYNQTDIFAGQRDFSKADLGYDFYGALQQVDYDGDGTPDDPTYTEGSSSIPEGYYRHLDTDLEGAGNETWQRLRASNDDATTFLKSETDGFRAFRGTGNSDIDTDGDGVTDGDFYNYQPENYLVTPSKRITLWGHGDYELHRRATAYFEASYTNRSSEQLLAAEPLFTATEGIFVSQDNVYNPFGRDFYDYRRRLVEFGNRISSQQVSTYRAALGMNGTFTDDGFFSTWNWDANFIYGRTDGVDQKDGSLILHKLQSAIGPSHFDEGGNAVCGTMAAPVMEACTPINLFGGPGSITQDQLRGLTYRGTAAGFSMQRMVNVTLNGEIAKLWKRPVGLALGYNFRREDGAFQPDPLTASGDTTGNKTEPTGGGYSENAGFIELQVPLLADLPAVQLFEVQGAVRAFSFSTFGSGATYKFGGRWQLFDHLAFRATYSTAFRAPSIAELYSGQADDFPDAVDPCSTFDRTRTANQEANCGQDGIPTALADDRTQLITKVGGNPALDAETANIFTAGVVITPKGHKLIDGLSFTFDYFAIAVDNSIAVKGPEVILNNCYTFENRSDCDLILRDGQGYVQRITDLNTNTGGVETAGFDFGAVYQLPTDFGTFRFNFDGVVLAKFDDIQATRTVDGVGVYDLEGVYAPFRFNAGVGWGWEGFTAGLNGRYVSPITECELNDCSQESRDAFAEMVADAQATDPTFDDTVFHERKVSYNLTADLYAGYSFTTSMGYTSLMAGINNLFDSPPPRIFNGFLANSDAANYDYLGRYFFIGLRHAL
jgi:outer membrane receptor protein involved in Fe transport